MKLMKFVLECLFSIKQVSVQGHFPRASLSPPLFSNGNALAGCEVEKNITGNQRFSDSCVIPYRLNKTGNAKVKEGKLPHISRSRDLLSQSLRIAASCSMSGSN